MRKEKRRVSAGFWLLIIVGSVIAVAAAFLFGSTAVSRYQWKQQANEALPVLEEFIPTPEAAMVTGESGEPFPAMEVDGQDYCGIVAYPFENKRLAVFAHWDSSARAPRPAVLEGTPAAGNLIIGGTADDDGFGFISRCEAGDELTFTDVFGHLFTYTVAAVVHRDNADVTTLREKNHDLTLFTKKEGQYLILWADNASDSQVG